MRHEQQIMAGLADLPLSAPKSRAGEKHRTVTRPFVGCLVARVAFDPQEPAGYEAAKAPV
jgi:hypothetical protein